MNIVLKNVGVNKVKVIKIVREVTEMGLKEAKDIVDSVEMGNEYTITNISREDVQTVIADFTQAGALAVEEYVGMNDFDAAINAPASDLVSDIANFQEESIKELEKDTTESVSNVNKRTTYQPMVSANDVGNLDRQGTMDVLIEVGKIAKESEGYNEEIADLAKRIDNEQKKAEEFRKSLSAKANKTILKATIIAALIGAIWRIPFGKGYILSAVVFGAIAYFIARAIIAPKDLKEHEVENNANADAYIQQNVEPLQDRLKEVHALIADLNDSGRMPWAIDVVGRDLFYSACISDLYNLVKSRRADSLKEALNKYDDEQYKARMKEMQRAIQNASEVSAAEAVKQTAYSRDIAKSAHQTATAAKATAYHTRQTARNTRRFR